MAILDNKEINFTGSLGKFTAYRMSGSDKIILRTKGGPTKSQIRNSPNFEQTRLNNVEFSGAVKAVKGIKSTMIPPIQRLADHNFTPKLTGMCRKIQVQDKEKVKGQRGVHLSAHRELLAGFRLTKKNPFVNLVSQPLKASLDREEKKAIVQLPRLIKSINFMLPWKLPLFRFLFSLGIVEDIVHDGNGYNECDHLPVANADTEWHENGVTFLPQTVELKLDMPEALRETQTMILFIGIEMGHPDASGEIRGAQYAGSAYILAVG